MYFKIDLALCQSAVYSRIHLVHLAWRVNTKVQTSMEIQIYRKSNVDSLRDGWHSSQMCSVKVFLWTSIHIDYFSLTPTITEGTMYPTTQASTSTDIHCSVLKDSDLWTRWQSSRSDQCMSWEPMKRKVTAQVPVVHTVRGNPIPMNVWHDHCWGRGGAIAKFCGEASITDLWK